jgi:signal transduction histidine kinase
VKLTVWPRSLAGRTIFILLAGFSIIQTLGLGIHTVNEIKLVQIEEQREIATQDVIIYRHIAAAAPSQRATLLNNEPIPRGDTIAIADHPPSPGESFQLPVPARQILRASIVGYGIPLQIRPRGLELRGLTGPLRYVVSFGLPDDKLNLHGFPGLSPGADLPPPPPNQDSLRPPPLASSWLIITSPVATPAPWRSPDFATAFIVMFILGALMIFWAVHRLLQPVKTLAEAAERLGKDVSNAPPLPESGPSEIATAAIAFNTMSSRIRKFVDDRTFLLTAIGHDLRTPITRLKLRAEYMDDDEQRLKMLADLDEMESMVAATLAFGRDITTSEPINRIDLASLLRTLLDEASDGNPAHGDHLSYEGPEHLTINARSLSLKRAFMNLIGNALKYGDSARVRLVHKQPPNIFIDIEDSGPGIPAADAELVFEPFRRLETSRNRETGGSGLGLSIARNIIRAHGGDIFLQNLPEGGLRARVTLPV